jgi:sugar lactone lactonase YvrE
VWAVDLQLGHLWRIDPDSGDANIVATVTPPADNLAIGPDDAVYISLTATSEIVRVDPDSGAQTVVVPGHFALVGGLAVMTHRDREVLLVADSYGYRIVDTQSGAVTTTFDITRVGFPNAASDVAVNDNYLALTDMVTRPRVFLVDRTNYETITTWTGIEAPAGVILQANGDPIVADFASGQIIGLHQADRKRRDLLVEGLAGPVGLAWAGPATVYVSEAYTGTLLRIDLNNGTKATIVTGLVQPEGLSVLADGRIAVVEVGRQRLLAIDPESGNIEVLATDLPVGEPAAGAPALVHVPSGVAQGADGSLYIGADHDNSILKLNPYK